MNWPELLRQLEPLVIDASNNGVQKSKDKILGLLESYPAQHEDFQKYVHFDKTR